ncbi:MAG TPA: helix-turn-helix domain-containing protein [Candidatus Acidoferrales bacterium]|nr:helix-turn-helix domain-containing protein [Candidatus Acidoferrales bacterium]
MTPRRIQKIRKALGLSQEDFAHILWVTWSTVNRWEIGNAAPTGMNLRILILLEHGLAKPSFRKTLRDPRAADPMFLLYRLLERAGSGDRRNTLLEFTRWSLES